jgi:tetratricopeptide (TPR) repeat protein
VLFDLKSGKRRRVVQVVFGFLAFIFFISFVGFGIGSDVTGGIFDAIGLGGGNSSGDPQYEQQIEDAEAALEADPNDANAHADLIAAYFGSAQSGISVSEETGAQVISPEARSDLQKAAEAWDRYIASKPKEIAVTTAGNAVQVFVLLGDAAGAAEAQAVVADDQRTAAAYAQLALYLYADGQIKEGDAAGEKAVDAADPSQRKQVQKTIDSYREQAIKYQEQLEEAQQQGGQEQGEQQLNDPFGNLGGGTAPVTPTP